MKKEEAKQLAIKKSEFVMETLALILTDSVPVEGRIEFDSAKKGQEKVCTLEVYVPQKKYERHWFMDIPTIHCNLFYEQILKDLLDNFGSLEKIYLGDFYTIKYDNNQNFCGLNLKNSIGTKVTLNFICKSNQLEDLMIMFQERKEKLILNNDIEEKKKER